MTAKASRTEVREACKDMKLGEVRTFTIAEGVSIRFLSMDISDDRNDTLVVSLARDGYTVTATCYDPANPPLIE